MRRSASEIIRNLEMRIARLEKQARSLGDLSGKQVCKIVAKELSDLYHTTVRPRQVEEAMESFLTEYEYDSRTLSDAEFEDVKINVYRGRRVGLKGEMELREGATNDFYSYGREQVSLIFVFNADLNEVNVRSTRLM